MKNTNTAYNMNKQFTKEIAKPLATNISSAQAKPVRWSALDIARGLAITLMILSHSVKGLLSQSMIPEWGIVPIHLLTKFSSSLFIIVFGIGISLYFLPHTTEKTWGKKRLWLIKRSIELMIWYKFLTVVQTFQFYPQSMIIDLLLFKSMPDFVEILCFYSIALMWLPFFMPTWVRLSYASKTILIFSMFTIGQWLHYHFDFWQIDTLKAILVENEGYYTFGQFQRGALVFLGMLIGDIYKKRKDQDIFAALAPVGCIVMGIAGLVYFYFINSENISSRLNSIAHNVGKHPFDLNFLSFSLGGALLILGMCLLAGNKLQKFMGPISYIGKHSLNAFILHIIIIFYLYRYIFNLHHKVTYIQSLGLAAACIVSIIVLLYIWDKTKATLS